jgi:hypothetical protein
VTSLIVITSVASIRLHPTLTGFSFRYDEAGSRRAEVLRRPKRDQLAAGRLVLGVPELRVTRRGLTCRVGQPAAPD